VLRVPFSALTLMVGWVAGGHAVHKKPVPLISKGSLLEQVEENLRRGPPDPISAGKTAVSSMSLELSAAVLIPWATDQKWAMTGNVGRAEVLKQYK